LIAVELNRGTGTMPTMPLFVYKVNKDSVFIAYERCLFFLGCHFWCGSSRTKAKINPFLLVCGELQH